jgi:hypothetical protein
MLDTILTLRVTHAGVLIDLADAAGGQPPPLARLQDRALSYLAGRVVVFPESSRTLRLLNLRVTARIWAKSENILHAHRKFSALPPIYM